LVGVLKCLIREYVINPLVPFHLHDTSASLFHKNLDLLLVKNVFVPIAEVLFFQLSSILDSHIINSAMYMHTANYFRNLPQIPYGTPNHIRGLEI